MMLLQEEKERFLSKIKEVNGCWEWQGSVSDKGYGQVTISRLSKSTMKSHRVSYLQYKGQIPEGLFVLHECDNRKCVNPDHLFTGTAKDNTDDMIRKGRYHSGSSYGSTNGASKLTEDEVLQLVQQLNLNNKQLADKYKISSNTVSDIRTGKTWNHLTNIKKKSA